MRLNRRKFLQSSTNISLLLYMQSLRESLVRQVNENAPIKIGNPFEQYPDRRWQEVYRPESNNPRER